MPAAYKVVEAPVGRVFLLPSNPRHVPFDTEGKVISYLCEKENVHPLARDIVKLGLNPLEQFAFISAEKRKTNQIPHSYYVAEGNRRLCAIKLLNDPELAPANLRKAFEKLAVEWTPVKTVFGVLFDGLDDVKVWLDRIHNGEQGGIGRRQWDSEQKSRSDGESKNKSAQALLDYAQREGMISAEDREGKLTTVQRFLTSDVFREQIGFDQTVPDQVAMTRPKVQFDIILRRFMRDLVGKVHVNSRMNKPDIIKYARPLGSMIGITSERIEPEALTPGLISKRKKVKGRIAPAKPEKIRHVQFEQPIFEALKEFGNGKLESLYYSLCSVDLEPHTPLVAVGTWAFFECLTACAGRADGNDFLSFLNKNRLNKYGFSGDTLSYREALGRIKAYGNTTKHHPVMATFNGDQLNNDMVALKDVILKLIEDATKLP